MLAKGLLLFLGVSGVLAAQTPAVVPNGVISAAAVTAGEPVAPGSLISIFGSDLAAGTVTADSIPLSIAMGDVTSVQVNGKAVPLLFVSRGQINAQLPWDVPAGAASVVVNRTASSSAPASFQVAQIAAAPYFYKASDGKLYALAQNTDDYLLAWPQGLVNGLTTEPVRRGRILVIYANGLGPVNPPVTTGDKAGSELRNAMTAPTVLIGGVQATVAFAGMSPDYVGVNQINVTVPDNAPTGDAVPLQLSVGGVASSDQVVIAVR